MNYALHDPLPMCLHYAVWAIAAFSDPQYRQNATGFYKQARRYVEADQVQVSQQATHGAFLRIWPPELKKWCANTVCSSKPTSRWHTPNH